MSGYKLTSKKAQIKAMVGNNFAHERYQQEKLRRLSERIKATETEKKEKDIMMAKAAEFVEKGIPFEMAPKELQEHYFFKVGYEVAIRRKKALEMQENKKMGGR